jgi:ribosomal protein S14
VCTTKSRTFSRVRLFGISLPATPAYARAMTTCSFCGRQEPDEATTLTWTTAVENGRRRTYCESCSRQHLRAMEGKLDSEYW